MSGEPVTIIDYGAGNLASLRAAFRRQGWPVRVAADADVVVRARRLVLPGVGAAPPALAELRRRGLDAALRAALAAGGSLFGICLGMQLLFERSSELGGADGLGFLAGEVAPLDAPGLKIPQIGWNAVSWRRASRLCGGLPDPCAFYHVHSFAPRPADVDDVLASADYGGEFVTAVEREPVYGVQFHPEKSGPHGLRLLGNFAAISAADDLRHAA